MKKMTVRIICGAISAIMAITLVGGVLIQVMG